MSEQEHVQEEAQAAPFCGTRQPGGSDLGVLQRRCVGTCKAFNSHSVALICGGLCTAFTRQMARALPCQVAFAASLKSEARDLIECTLTLELEAEINQDL